MEEIKNLLKIKEKKKEVKTTNWQFEALEAIKRLADGNLNKGAIFKCFKKNEGVAKIAFNDSIELSKPYSKYFFKVFNEIIVKQKRG